MSLERIPTDPSEELMRLMGTLQHTKPTEELVPVPAHLFNEAVGMIRGQGYARIGKQGESREHALFCGHWITPA